MRIAVLGTGMVGRAFAVRLTELGHEVSIGTRDLAATMARAETDQMGNAPFPQWAAEHPEVTPATFADAAESAELILNASAGSASIAVLEAAGDANLAGKIIVDISNPLDHSAGMPPTLFVKDTDSLAEQIQRAFPAAKVVKTLNTMNASLMVEPRQLADGDFSTFVSGNDADAKSTVTALLESLGHTDVIDLGDISTARGAEMILPIWLRLWGALGTPTFNFKIVR
jgi:predicted dinucleotide-binding enzyme